MGSVQGHGNDSDSGSPSSQWLSTRNFAWVNLLGRRFLGRQCCDQLQPSPDQMIIKAK